jgi:hypothetical protein
VERRASQAERVELADAPGRGRGGFVFPNLNFEFKVRISEIVRAGLRRVLASDVRRVGGRRATRRFRSEPMRDLGSRQSVRVIMEPRAWARRRAPTPSDCASERRTALPSKSRDCPRRGATSVGRDAPTPHLSKFETARIERDRISMLAR